MEIGLIRLITDIFKSAPKAGLFLGCMFLVVFAGVKILPIILNFLKDLMSHGQKEQSLMVSLIREELQSGREQIGRQFELNERHTKALEVSVSQLQELMTRTASLDHRMTEAHERAAQDHTKMHENLIHIRGCLGQP